MLDRAPTKPNRYAVYDDAHNFLRYEYHERADEPTQAGDALNKATLLSDATAAKLNGVKTPNAAFGLLSRFHAGLGNEYVWSKTKSPYVLSLGTTQTGGAWSTFTGGYYADDVLVNSATGEITYVNPQAMSGFPGTTIVNKYVYPRIGTSVAHLILSVTVSESAFSSYAYKDYSSTRLTTLYGYVNSPDSAAYPPSVSDGYTYTALGQIGSNAQIATGSYTGAGTYGSGNPNSLTFGFVPKFIAINGKGLSKIGTVIFVNGATKTYEEYCFDITEISGWGTNTVSWYSDHIARDQANFSGAIYKFVAIG